MIKYEVFKKLDMRIGLVKSCEDIPESKNLYKLIVDCGEPQTRQIITGIKNFYSADELVDQKIIILANLEPKKIMGYRSEGMLLAADVEGIPVLLKLDESKRKIVPPGAKIK
ncbi:MAG: Methionyl-tRNA synthetase/methionyl-tRNA synthetase subunit beta [Promethearchaeota archaeon]|jgi:methionine--tRNA ligase beta chain|nr:MAG: Methionyl-tRNA synthetase/methionyl-tRNA synthetase subunit beta [Candidatus Lokiarchaeota archaeon]